MKIQEFFSNIIESMPSALIAVDAELMIKLINKNALQISDLESDRVLNKSVMDSFPMLEDYRAEIKSALENAETVTLDRVEYNNQELNKYYMVTCYPLAAIEDMIVIQIDDSTRREMLEQRILQTEKMHSLDGLAAGIAHEVNNPLSAIINGIQNINRRLEPSREANTEVAAATGVDLEKLAEYLQQREIKFFLESIEEGAHRASNIVSNMLNFSKPNSSVRESCNINILLDQAIHFVLKDYELHNNSSFSDLDIEKKFTDDLPNMQLPPLELQQVFINLLRNAEQAISGKCNTIDELEDYQGKISLETRLDGEDLIIVIADNGCGMTDPTVRKVFDPYFSTRHKSGGHGLGLSTVYRIIKSQLVGEIEVRSAIDVGTQFIITLRTSVS
jgi:PAS domain S-box-containing protein